MFIGWGGVQEMMFFKVKNFPKKIFFSDFNSLKSLCAQKILSYIFKKEIESIPHTLKFSNIFAT